MAAWQEGNQSKKNFMLWKRIMCGVQTDCSEWDKTTGLFLKQTAQPHLMEDSKEDVPQLHIRAAA